VKSIRRQLTRQILTGTFLMLLLAGVVFCVVVRSRVVAEFDRALEAKARALVVLTSREERALEIDFDDEAMPEFAADNADEDGEEHEKDDEDEKDEEEDDEEEREEDGPEYFAVLLPDGSVVRKSSSLGSGVLPVRGEAGKDVLFRSLRLPDGRRGRLVQIAFAPAVDEPDQGEADEPEEDEDRYELPATVDENSLKLVLVVARSRERFDALLAFLYLTFALMSVLLLLGSGLVVRTAIRRGFRPLDVMNAQVRRIGPESLDGRIRLASPPDELATIVAGLNELLERVENGFARERRFSSDVAHELRTPVAELRTACEVGARWPDDPVHARQFFNDIEDVARQMERIVDNLLELTRCDNGTSTVVTEAVDVRALVEECWRRAARDADANRLRLDNRVELGAAVTTDPGKLQMILQNVIDNAVFYSVPGSTVVCRSDRPDDRSLALVAANEARDLERKDLETIFDRFWRKDAARTGGRHSGLGLSLVKDLARLLGIELHVDLKEGSIFVVRMVFQAGATPARDREERAGATPCKEEEQE